jgi:hypothetical protein
MNDTCIDGVCVGGPYIDCSDGNPCTGDVCNPSVGCSNPDIAGPCDDGLFCNGTDTCIDGSCSAHTGDPCPAGTTCDEGGDACVTLTTTTTTATTTTTTVPGEATRLDLGTGQCTPGSEETLDLTLSPVAGVGAGGCGTDLAWDPTLLEFVEVEAGPTTLARNGACSESHDQGAGTAIIACFTTDSSFFGIPYEAGVVARVTFRCLESAAAGTDAIISNTPSCSTVPPIAPVEPMTGEDGVCAIVECTGLPGDTDHDCNTDIVELQSCIGMFLNLVPVDLCAETQPTDGQIGIVDLQNCIAAFLELLSCP